ncbi:GIY-YIG nuclease family protein [Aspergillus ruber CBS 135680]|uniref:DUF1766-domain-containing protein n=1 Tax=Aspergillus ruber (strain CBS 135680) TaxID=1388766 RepID=A0A017SGH5_ASPRC|nr:DUF1766-domain-containing protein [Aspergillus ruber CBS 135680]EYE96053.1 DUF1766-domain-containing protein [Aspergillus ruber CBS 135680]
MVPKSALANISPPSSPPQTDEFERGAWNESEDKFYLSRTPSTLPYTPPTSPPPDVSKSTTADKALTEEITQLSVSSLRTLLGIDNWKCGCITSKGHPCKMPISNLKADINMQIGLLTNPNHSTQKLRDELYKLAKLVHCRYHDDRTRICSRVDSWRNAFSFRESTEEQIERTLRYYSAYCAGVTKQGNSCHNKMGGQCVQNRAKTINKILTPDIYLDDDGLDYFLLVLKENMFCCWHINYQGPEKVEIWKKEILKIRKERSPVLAPPKESNMPEDEGSHTFYDDLTAQSTSQDPDNDPATYWPRRFDTTPFDIIATSDQSNDFKSSFPEIYSELTKPLVPEDQKEGYLYAYEVEGNEGFVKIGYTCRFLEKRHEEWAFDCNRKSKALYPIPLNHQVAVPNAHRVEALCHAELKHRNIRIDCHGCLRPHIEWFQCSPEEAVAVIQKWSMWMLTSPYKPESHETSAAMILKEKERVKAECIDQFMKGLLDMVADQPLSEK